MRKKSYVLILFAALVVLCAALVGCGKVARTYHRVSVAECENGRVYVTYRGEKVGGATAGERLSINLLPDTGYEVDYVKIDGAASEGVYFDMPDNDVNISAAFKRVTYGVTVSGSISGGTIAADKTKAAYGEKITVTVTPDEGYVLKERTLVANNTEIYKPRATEAIVTEFVMPPCDVAIKGEFVSTETFITRISTLEEYISFANAVNGGDNYVGRTVILENDIGTEAAPVWTRVGASAANYFGGTFDGNGKTVYLRLTTDTDSDNSVGAFGYVGGATIKNLTVKGTVVKNGDNGGAGGIAGAVLYSDGKETIIDGCVSYASVSAANKYDAGGIVGATTGNLKIANSVNYGSVFAGISRAGGILGNAYCASIDKKISVGLIGVGNAGTVSVGGASGVFGGIAGRIGVNDRSQNVFDGFTIGYVFAGCTDKTGRDLVVGRNDSVTNVKIYKITVKEGA